MALVVSRLRSHWVERRRETTLPLSLFRQASALSSFRTRREPIHGDSKPTSLLATVLKQHKALPWLECHHSVDSIFLVVEEPAGWALQLGWVLTPGTFANRDVGFRASRDGLWRVPGVSIHPGYPC